MTLLQIDNLHVGFRLNAHPNAQAQIHNAVRGVSLDIAAGQTHALVGESGSGKSVTALSILKLLPYPPAFHAHGRILFAERDLMTQSERALQAMRGNEIAMIFQEPLSSLNPLHRIGKQICEAIRLHQGGTQSGARVQALRLLERVGLPDAARKLTQFPHQLSGGQRQRVMIAMALANRPKLLIADEPTTALDVTIEKQILDLLRELQAEMGMAILLITHDLGVVRKMAQYVSVMKDGRVVESGTIDDVLHHPHHSYSRALIAAEPSGTPLPPPAKSDTLLSAEHIKVHFRISGDGLWRKQTIKAVDDVSFTLRRGQSLGVVGESGSGKTSLGRAILGLQAAKGRAIFDGTDILNAAPHQRRALRRDMQIVFQDPYGALSPRMTVGDIIAEGLRVHAPHLSPQQRGDHVAHIMSEVELDPSTSNRYPHEFSGGQRQRIAIARALILQPQFLVLDEPTSALDRSVQAQIMDMLRRLQSEKQLTYLFISHDLKLVRTLAHNVLVMKDGKIVEAGNSHDIFTHPQHNYTRSLLDAAFDM